MKKYNYQNKARAIHSISLACKSLEKQNDIAKKMAELNIGVIVCPSAAISMVQENKFLTPIHNSIAPIQVLINNGVDVALGITNEENLENISESAKHFVKAKKEFMFDAEHFFDGYKANPKYALSCIKAAYDEGARWIVLCDTNGGTLPHEISKIVNEVSKVIPGKNLGIHAHNDTGNAVANSLAAVLSGARQVQGTINGLGERCGNANLMSLIPTFFLKKDFSSQFEIGIKSENIKNLTECSRLLDEILNRKPNQHLPYVGAAAFSHKGGLHVSAVQKDPKTYEHINPEEVGNTRNIVVSDQSGKSNFRNHHPNTTSMKFP